MVAHINFRILRSLVQNITHSQLNISHFQLTQLHFQLTQIFWQDSKQIIHNPWLLIIALVFYQFISLRKHSFL